MMTSEFKKGFATGLALKSIPFYFEYSPTVWNDYGVYSYFYIDFLKPVGSFSIGMLQESIYVFTTSKKTITGFERIDNRKFKIYCDISDGYESVCVINIANTKLKFSTNDTKMKEFSVGFKLAGGVRLSSIPYIVEAIPVVSVKQKINENARISMSSGETVTRTIHEQTNLINIPANVSELQVLIQFTE